MSSNHLPPSHAARLRSERGASLIFALFGLVTLTILGVGLTSLGMMATTMASNERDTQDALALADAGLSHAKKMILFQEWPWDNMTPLLTSGDGQACNGDELAQAPPGAPGGYPTLFITAAEAGGQPLGTAGTYRVYVCDDDVTDVDDAGVPNNDPHVDVNKRILVRSVGTTATGATATVEQIFESGEAPALLVNGNLSVRGNVEVGGENGIIHANGQMDIVGNSVCAHEYFSSTETITGGIPEGGENCEGGDGELRPGSAPVNIRLLSPAEFKPLARFWFSTITSGGGGGGGKGGGGGAKVEGLVYENSKYPAPATEEKDWQVVATPVEWNFFEGDFSWKTNGGVVEAVYYFDTNVTLGGNIEGTGVGGAAKMTVLAEGSVDVAGSAKLESMLAPIPRIGAITIVAGRDLELSGNTGGGGGENAFKGLFYARHQVNITGSPIIKGQVIALNEADTPWPTVAPSNQVKPDNPVVLEDGFMKIAGTPKITYDSEGLEGVTGRFWRECRYSPDNENPLVPNDACGPQWGGT